MKHLYLSLAALVLGTTPALAIFEDITWFSGVWGYEQEINNFTIEAIGSINGQVDDCVDLVVPDPWGEDPANPGIAKKITIVGPAQYGTRETYIYKVKAESAENNVFRFSATSTSAPVRIQGDYTVTFPAGCMIGDGVPNQQFSVTFHVKDETVYRPEEIQFQSNPIAGIPLSSLEQVTLSFDCMWQEGETGGQAGSEKYAVKGINSEKTVTLTNTASGEVLDCSIVSTSSITGRLAYKITPPSPIVTSGQYRLNVPEDVIRLTKLSGTTGHYVEEDVCNMALSYTYIVDSDAEGTEVRPVVTPNAGDVAALSRLDFYAPEGYQLFLPDNAKSVAVTLPNGSTVSATPYTNVNVEGQMAFLSLPETYTQPGKYTFSFPAGCFELVDGSNTLLATNAYTLTYNVVDTEPVEMSWTSTPADGATVYFLQNVYVMFDQPVTGVSGVKPVCIRPDGTQIADAVMSFNSTYNRLMIDLRYPAQYGEYTVTVPEGSVMNDNHEVNAPIVLHFTYLQRPVADIDFLVYPGQGVVERLRSIEIEAPAGYTELERVDQGLAYVTFRVGNQEWKEYITATADPIVCRVELSPVSEGRPEFNAGDEINMIVDEGCFRLTATDGTQVINAMKVYSWEIAGSGVETLLSIPEGCDVYNLQGMKVCTGDDADALRSLKGIFIVNGKKVRL